MVAGLISTLPLRVAVRMGDEPAEGNCALLGEPEGVPERPISLDGVTDLDPPRPGTQLKAPPSPPAQLAFRRSSLLVESLPTDHLPNPRPEVCFFSSFVSGMTSGGIEALKRPCKYVASAGSVAVRGPSLPIKRRSLLGLPSSSARP